MSSAVYSTGGATGNGPVTPGSSCATTSRVKKATNASGRNAFNFRFIALISRAAGEAPLVASCNTQPVNALSHRVWPAWDHLLAYANAVTRHGDLLAGEVGGRQETHNRFTSGGCVIKEYHVSAP